ncbi:peptidase inhibitor family I36 protein [Streptomyces sp. NBC_01387]|uniref:peptidase inhibitor family I36 protein n=1 Tax=unclassified Streptomyces TaxID=2593676 RepID=UPI00225554D2|nr:MULTISPECIES: peptidase inhibitor family I36 protein [unclassified Streptomyces]MCX4548215.1 peptidase inhibitor family I36 protein [Streptomyces sp. NBC_01500]WSC19875.1 peptidase inhibitor family I36 protein [Streptomyces sp. NBC_01766]WSV53894.1 peptidase inhibitor family I36 protein [Streptomyces sp. NBC_01014]
MRIASTARRSLLAGAGAAAALALTAAAPASSAPKESGPDDCYPGWVCFWPEANFGGQMEAYQNPQIHSCDSVPSGTVRSIVNRDDQDWTVSQSWICNGYSKKVASGEVNPDLGDSYGYWK